MGASANLLPEPMTSITVMNEVMLAGNISFILHTRATKQPETFQANISHS